MLLKKWLALGWGRGASRGMWARNWLRGVRTPFFFPAHVVVGWCVPAYQVYRATVTLFHFRFAPVCHGAAAHLGHRGWDLTNILQMHKCDKNRQVLRPTSFVLGCNLPLPNILPPAKFHPINQKIVLACHLQHSMSVLVSATGCHPRSRHTEQMSNNQACTCLTKFRNRALWSRPIWAKSENSPAATQELSIAMFWCVIFLFPPPPLHWARPQRHVFCTLLGAAGSSHAMPFAGKTFLGIGWIKTTCVSTLVWMFHQFCHAWSRWFGEFRGTWFRIY